MTTACSRRELLAWLAGAAIAAQACRRKPKRIAGSLLGSSMQAGHRLRGSGAELSVERASGRPRRVRVAIIGAGASGLSAAWRLQRLGEASFVVLELEKLAGGTSAFGTDGVVPHPWGAHYVPVPTRDNVALGALLAEMGVVETGAGGELVALETALVREPRERVFVDGEWHDDLFPTSIATARDLEQLERFQQEIDRWVVWRDARGRRAFEIPVARASDAAELTALDKLTAAVWLDQRGFDSVPLRWYVEYACKDDYGLSLASTSAWAMLFYFASRVPAPRAESAPFLTWPEGNGRLVAHLAGVAGSRLSTGQLVTDIVPGEDQVELAVFDLASEKLAKIVAERVILAVPRFVAAKIARPLRGRTPAELGGFGYGSWLVANLHLSRRPRSRGVPMAWDNVLYDSPSLGYVVATHQTLADLGPTIWTYYLPLVDRDPAEERQRLAELDHASACSAILADLGRAHDDLDACVDRIDVWRWGHAMVRPTPGAIWHPARRRAAQPIGRLHFAHSDLSGVALFEEAQHQGIRAAEEVLEALGHPPPTRLVAPRG
jgi:hypothetical protein